MKIEITNEVVAPMAAKVFSPILSLFEGVQALLNSINNSLIELLVQTVQALPHI
jgi:hypothetical protein